MDFEIPFFLVMLGQIVAGVSLALFIISFVFIFMNKKLDDREKILWLLGSVLLPILGPILFMTWGGMANDLVRIFNCVLSAIHIVSLVPRVLMIPPQV